eukprot:CAMPEP_0177646338 /NCGR_PEP_ID=MMETSP0447-20121125/9723_1 /TAXON_ID=0 /ORGANISM="Stygamoeba regulata, Strain BSH-02190019" /LENGTH=131 /DNA_ID=CAMNT_0019148869 /DNA_START=43 /DNA_END=438 /DNA_ORIENTATION=+
MSTPPPPIRVTIPRHETVEPDVDCFDHRAHGDEEAAYTVYHVCFSRADSGAAWHIDARYSAFYALYERLLAEGAPADLPLPPPKKWVGNMETDFVAARATALAAWLQALLADARVAAAPALLEFCGMPRAA